MKKHKKSNKVVKKIILKGFKRADGVQECMPSVKVKIIKNSGRNGIHLSLTGTKDNVNQAIKDLSVTMQRISDNEDN